MIMRNRHALFRTATAIALALNLRLVGVTQLHAEASGDCQQGQPSRSVGTPPQSTTEQKARFKLATLEAALRAEGLSFDKTTLPDGDVLYGMRIAGVKFALIAYGTAAGSATTMQLVATFSDNSQSRAKKVDTVNQWNKEKRFLKAYVDGDNDVTLEMDLVAVGPVEPKELERTISETWAMGLMYFAVSSH